MATVQGVKLKKGGTPVFPITHINAVKNENGQNLTTVLGGYVPTSRKVNGKALSGDITLSASDVGASANGHTHDDRYHTETEIGRMFGGISPSKTVSQTFNCANNSDIQYINALNEIGVWYSVTLTVNGLGHGSPAGKIASPKDSSYQIMDVAYQYNSGSSTSPSTTALKDHSEKPYGKSLSSGTVLFDGAICLDANDSFYGKITFKMMRLL